MTPELSSDPLQLGEILETCLYVDDLGQAEKFYGSVLGLRLFAKETSRHLFFKCGRQMLLVFNPAATLAEKEIAPHGARGPGHVAFSVPLAQMDLWRTRLSKSGIGTEKDVTWPNGGRSLYFRDPAGNCLEFTSPVIWGMTEDAANSRTYQST